MDKKTVESVAKKFIKQSIIYTMYEISNIGLDYEVKVSGYPTTGEHEYWSCNTFFTSSDIAELMQEYTQREQDFEKYLEANKLDDICDCDQIVHDFGAIDFLGQAVLPGFEVWAADNLIARLSRR